jgi:hypothetical protein
MLYYLWIIFFFGTFFICGSKGTLHLNSNICWYVIISHSCRVYLLSIEYFCINKSKTKISNWILCPVSILKLYIACDLFVFGINLTVYANSNTSQFEFLICWHFIIFRSFVRIYLSNRSSGMCSFIIQTWFWSSKFRWLVE